MIHRIISRACALITLGAFAGVSTADIITVPGMHSTINAALIAAASGDVIEITSNASPYVESLRITKNNITIRGQAGLEPRPTIQGIGAAHPRAGQGPIRWNPQTADNTYDTSGVAVLNEADGLVLQNLIVEAASAAGALDFRFGTNGMVTNCRLNAPGRARGSFTANAHTFNNVHFNLGNVALEHQGGPGTLTLTGCTLQGAEVGTFLYGGTIVVEDTLVGEQRLTNSARGAEIGNQYGAVHATFRNSIFRRLGGAGSGHRHAALQIFDRGAGGGTDSYGTGRWSPGSIEAIFDQCDFIGSAHNAAIALASGRVSWNVKTLKVTNSNFYNIAGPSLGTYDFPFPGNNYSAGGAVERFEDYNVFKMAVNTASMAGIQSGGHSLSLTRGEPLFADPVNGDFQLAANSPAATLRAPATPPYTGTLGVSSTTVPVNRVTVGHTGADYPTINAAIAATTDGALIEIVDNSAPYPENVEINSGNGKTIQGASTLSSRPIIRPSIGTFGVRLTETGGTSRNITLRDLIIDASLLTDANVLGLEMRDLGESVVENSEIIGGPGVSWSVFTARPRIMTDCNIIHGRGSPAVQHNVGGNFAFTNCNVQSVGSAVETLAGSFQARNVFLSGDGSRTVLLGGGGNAHLHLQDSIVTSNAPLTVNGPGVSNNLIVIRHHATQRRFLTIDNSDLIGSLQAEGSGASPTGTGVIIETAATGTINPVTFINVTDTILYNLALHDYFLNGNTGIATIPGLTFDIKNGFENYNAYKFAPSTLQDQGVTPGANNLNLISEQSLYNNAATGDFRLVAGSPAATLNSTGNPAYAGSKGIVPSSVHEWSLYQ